MKKKIVLSAIIALSAIAFSSKVNAQATATTQQNAKVTVNSVDTGKMVKVDDLPAAVKTELAKDDYKSWKASSAVLIENGGNAYYRIVLSNGTATKTVKIDKNGKKLD